MKASSFLKDVAVGSAQQACAVGGDAPAGVHVLALRWDCARWPVSTGGFWAVGEAGLGGLIERNC